jgi:phospholipid transport system substrate-binding protein
MKLQGETMKYWLICLVFPVSVFAGAPLEAVRGSVDKVLDVLRDPSLKGESAGKVRKEKIRVISEKMFDFAELSKRTLAQNWRRFDPKQQKEFVGLHKFLLEDAYVNKIMSFTEEKVVFN